MPKAKEQKLETKEQIAAAIASAKSVAALDAIDKGLEERGWSAEGLMRVAILERKTELGYTASEEDEALVRLTTLRRERGAALPPISGRLSNVPNIGR